MKGSDLFLRLLGLKPEKPSYAFLEKIVRTHMTRIPFENISKLYYYKKEGLRYIPSFEQYLEGIEKYSFGGTCYSNNAYMSLLLKDLGFEADLCGADMTNPNVHASVIVNIGSNEYILDTGYAAPFFEPISRDQKDDQIIESYKDTYVIKPKDAADRTQIIMFRNNEQKHGYLLNRAPKQIDDFKDVIIDSFRPEAAFMNSILLTRFRNDKFIRLHNLQLSEIKGKTIEHKNISSKDELFDIIKAYFNIPHEVSRFALEEITFDKDAWT